MNIIHLFIANVLSQPQDIDKAETARNILLADTQYLISFLSQTQSIFERLVDKGQVKDAEDFVRALELVLVLKSPRIDILNLVDGLLHLFADKYGNLTQYFVTALHKLWSRRGSTDVTIIDDELIWLARYLIGISSGSEVFRESLQSILTDAELSQSKYTEECGYIAARILGLMGLDSIEILIVHSYKTSSLLSEFCWEQLCIVCKDPNYQHQFMSDDRVLEVIEKHFPNLNSQQQKEVITYLPFRRQNDRDAIINISSSVLIDYPDSELVDWVVNGLKEICTPKVEFLLANTLDDINFLYNSKDFDRIYKFINAINHIDSELCVAGHDALMSLGVLTEYSRRFSRDKMFDKKLLRDTLINVRSYRSDYFKSQVAFQKQRAKENKRLFVSISRQQQKLTQQAFKRDEAIKQQDQTNNAKRMRSRNGIVVVYSPEDRKYAGELETMFSPASKRYNIKLVLHPASDLAGLSDSVLREFIYQSYVLVLMLSSDMLKFEKFTRLVELAITMSKQLPFDWYWVHTGQCMYEETTVSEYIPLNSASKPLAGLSRSTRPKELKKIATEILRAYNETRKRITEDVI